MGRELYLEFFLNALDGVAVIGGKGSMASPLSTLLQNMLLEDSFTYAEWSLVVDEGYFK